MYSLHNFDWFRSKFFMNLLSGIENIIRSDFME
jgi:hypothetical protein